MDKKLLSQYELQERFETIDKLLYDFTWAITEQQRINTAGQIQLLFNAIQYYGLAIEISNFCKSLSRENKDRLDQALQYNTANEKVKTFEVDTSALDALPEGQKSLLTLNEALRKFEKDYL